MYSPEGSSADFDDPELVTCDDEEHYDVPIERIYREQMVRASTSSAQMEAKEALVLKNLKFAAYVARRTMRMGPSEDEYSPNGDHIFQPSSIPEIYPYLYETLPVADRIQEANINLMRAADRYRPELGHTFAAYVNLGLENSIMRAVDYDRNIQIPVNVLAAIRGAKGEMLGRSVLPQNMPVLGTNPTETQVISYIEAVKKTLPLDLLLGPQTAGEADETIPIIESVADEEEDVVELAFESIGEKDLHIALDLLKPRSAQILRMRFGIGCEPMTLEDVGRVFGLTRERVRSIEGEALRKLARIVDRQGMLLIDEEQRADFKAGRSPRDKAQEERTELLRALRQSVVGASKNVNKIKRQLEHVRFDEELSTRTHGHWVLGVDRQTAIKNMEEAYWLQNLTKYLYEEYLAYLSRTISLPNGPIRFNAFAIDEMAGRVMSDKEVAMSKAELYQVAENVLQSKNEMVSFSDQESFYLWLARFFENLVSGAV